MTSTPDLNISGSPIYENLVASSGDPYQPPAYQLPALYEPPDAQASGYGPQTAYGAAVPAPAYNYGNPAMLSQFLSRMFGDNQSWVAVVVFGGPMADQFRQSQQYQQLPPQQTPQPFRPGSPTGYADASGFGAMSAEQAAMAQAYQAYQQMMMYRWAAQQQTMQQQALPGQQPLALTAGPATQPVDAPFPAPPMPFDPSDQAAALPLGGMPTQDWADWLGQTSQSVRPQPTPQDEYQDDQEARHEPSYERRGGRLTGRLGAAMRELRGR